MSKKNKNISAVSIRLIVYDFDGVLTDNKVVLSEDGLESVVVNRADGLAISIFKRMGIKQVILSTETNKVVEIRARKLDVPVIRGIENKEEAIVSYCKENNIQLKNVVYVGNDLNDLDAMKIVGFPVCPSDACKEIKNISRFILNVPGGAGIARDLLQYITKN